MRDGEDPKDAVYRELGEETGQESAEQIAKEALEVISGNEPHSEEGENTPLESESHTEESESSELP